MGDMTKMSRNLLRENLNNWYVSEVNCPVFYSLQMILSDYRALCQALVKRSWLYAQRYHGKMSKRWKVLFYEQAIVIVGSWWLVAWNILCGDLVQSTWRRVSSLCRYPTRSGHCNFLDYNNTPTYKITYIHYQRNRHSFRTNEFFQTFRCWFLKQISHIITKCIQWCFDCNPIFTLLAYRVHRGYLGDDNRYQPVFRSMMEAGTMYHLKQAVEQCHRQGVCNVHWSHLWLHLLVFIPFLAFCNACDIFLTFIIWFMLC